MFFLNNLTIGILKNDMCIQVNRYLIPAYTNSYHDFWNERKLYTKNHVWKWFISTSFSFNELDDWKWSTDLFTGKMICLAACIEQVAALYAMKLQRHSCYWLRTCSTFCVGTIVVRNNWRYLKRHPHDNFSWVLLWDRLQNHTQKYDARSLFTFIWERK